MTRSNRLRVMTASWLVTAALAASSGCTAFLEPRDPYPVTPPEPSAASPVPRELEMVSLPPYVIEPPDILFLQATKIVPKPPHKLEPFDAILIRVLNTPADQPIADAFYVSPEGDVDLGPGYGRVKVVGLTTDEAQAEIRRHLAQIIDNPIVSVSLAAASGTQQISGEHLVGPDGRISLATYGQVYVAGLTLDQARDAIQKHLSQYLENPEVAVDVFAYNSKTYYVITQGAGQGDDVQQFPITGNDTVLSAIAHIGGISQLSSTRIFIARPAPNGVGCEQVLPVNWTAISQGGSTATNYQLMPGDRLYIREDPYQKFTSLVFKYTQPIERLFGFVSVGTAMANQIKRFGLGTL
ncbi:MAG TPA: polysaccharide biosynthesis/export family protein [Lacipirellulaceae bacterium]|nr:polysaccharide biosynthesis/export family protein [Lacipirellulaceae bacterium]